MQCYLSSGPIEADDRPEPLWVRPSLVPGEVMASIEKALQIRSSLRTIPPMNSTNTPSPTPRA